MLKSVCAGVTKASLSQGTKGKEESKLYKKGGGAGGWSGCPMLQVASHAVQRISVECPLQPTRQSAEHLGAQQE